jgi:phosphopantetheine--protein transferase-like protein
MRCGCDLVQVSRIAGLLDRREGGLERLFSEVEVADARRGDVAIDSNVALRRLAARWAAKEAAVKALGRLDLGPRGIEVRTLPNGAPELWVEGKPSDLAVSLSHEGELAMAFVVAPTSERVSTGCGIPHSVLTQAPATGPSPDCVSTDVGIPHSVLTRGEERAHAAR